jgi:beta-lactamase superfamily II metal-dependent hydrolase
MVFVVYYLALLTLLTGWIFRTKHKKGAVAALTVACALCAADWLHQRGAARMDVLALSGAPAVFAGGPGMKQDFLADCGDTREAEGIVKPFLRAHGVNHLDNFCLTAGYQQAAGGAEIILTNFAAAGVLAGPARARSPVYRRVEAALQSAPGRWRTVRAGDEAAGWTALYPTAEDQFAAADDLALAWQRTVHGHSVALLSVLGRDGQDLLVRRHPELRAEIVVAGLPMRNRDDALSEPLLDLLQPKLIIIADADMPATRRATTKLRERLARRAGTETLYCRDIGSITLFIRDGGWEARDAGGSVLLREAHKMN